MDDKSALLDMIVARLTTVARPARVIIFGSAVTETATADSDIDLLILLDKVDDARLESVRLRRALRGMGMPFDVIVMRTDRFEETKFHAQQTAEKSLKAPLVVRQEESVPAETAITCVSPARRANDEIARRLPEDIRH
ncbi:MAG: nucleotidyltransferase domain-containing protein [Thermoleophilia bacterium]